MERRSPTAVATFFAEEEIAAGRAVVLPDEAVQHARVRRLEVGDAIRLTNGRGSIAEGKLDRLTRDSAVVVLESVTECSRPPRVRLFVPVADRERMLWLAEKCAELAVSTWQPVVFRRSSSVSPRGEGEKFEHKVRARMIGALEQSGGAWLPELWRELPLADVLVRESQASAERFLLDRDGAPLVRQQPRAVDVMIGPEGGIEADERSLIAERHGWLPVSLGETTLRFETAGVVAAGVLRALLATA